MLSAPADCTLKFSGLSAQESAVSMCMGYGYPENRRRERPGPSSPYISSLPATANRTGAHP